MSSNFVIFKSYVHYVGVSQLDNWQSYVDYATVSLLDNWHSAIIYDESYFRVASKVDAVLLSHPDILHLGALPYAMKHLGLSAPVYSTEPVYRLGLLTMYDHYLSRRVSSW